MSEANTGTEPEALLAPPVYLSSACSISDIGDVSLPQIAELGQITISPPLGSADMMTESDPRATVEVATDFAVVADDGNQAHENSSADQGGILEVVQQTSVPGTEEGREAGDQDELRSQAEVGEVSSGRDTPKEEALSERQGPANDADKGTETPDDEVNERPDNPEENETESEKLPEPMETSTSEPMETSGSSVAATEPTDNIQVPMEKEKEKSAEVPLSTSLQATAAAIEPAVPDPKPGPSTGRTPRRAALKAETTIRNYARKERRNSGGDRSDSDSENSNSSKKIATVPSASIEPTPVFDGRTCVTCLKVLKHTPNALFWEAMEFCNSVCLDKCQKKIGSNCANCKKKVVKQSMGKYGVRFGANVRQFCCNPCLEEYKRALKVCGFCQLDVSDIPDAFTAVVGEKKVSKDFCSKWCKAKLESGGEFVTPVATKTCSVCSIEKAVQYEVFLANSEVQFLCSDPCLTAFKFTKELETCKYCKKLMDTDFPKKVTISSGAATDVFCSKTCANVYVLGSRKIVPCSNCKVKKYNFDMIEKYGEVGSTPTFFCSLHCFDICESSNRTRASSGTTNGGVLPKVRIASVASLTAPAPPPTVPAYHDQALQANDLGKYMMMRGPARSVKNKAIICKPSMVSKGIGTRGPSTQTQETQTDDNMGKPILIPVPLPVYVPSPMAMYNAPHPVPVLFPLPIPVPIFIPTTKNTTKRIAKEIKKILKKIPSDPLEAELLMMAEAVGETRKEDEGDSSSSDEFEDTVDNDMGPGMDSEDEGDADTNLPSSRMSGDDILQTAMRSAVDDIGSDGYMPPETAIDVEQALAGATTAVTKSLEPMKRPSFDDGDQYEPHLRRGGSVAAQRSPRTRSRSARGSRGGGGGGRGNKRQRTDYQQEESLKMQNHDHQQQQDGDHVAPEDRPDANMMLKFTFGVNAWRHWVQQKNQELEKLQRDNPKRRIRLFKKDLLQLSAEELCYALCMFVKEVKKPDGLPYTPDLVYYLCLGIQEYLLENNRVENVFNDQLYAAFTDCLDEVTRTFSGQQMLTELGYIMTHIEEEHLWEARQLGAQSPHVLLNTLMYFTTKHFLLTTEKDHTRLSFPHVMKHWKKGPGAPPTGRGGPQAVGAGAGAPRNVLLKYYPPASIRAEMGDRAKRSYEMHENTDNPVRCPIRLYEFYLSKCPESIKGKNEVFYLFPERSCVPHSPVWYSTMSLSEAVIAKMLHRILLVREIQDAIINDQ